MVAKRLETAAVISGLEVSVFTHATEDERKVERAVLNIISIGVGGTSSKVQRLRGHFNDPIVLTTMRIRKRKAAREAFRSLIRSLSPLDRRRLLDEAEDRVDNAGNLYLRLDKQSAYLGRAVLHDADPIHMKTRFRPPHSVDPVRAVRESLAAIIDEAEQESGRQNPCVD